MINTMAEEIGAVLRRAQQGLDLADAVLESGSSSSAEAFRASRCGRWWKERKADAKIPSKMFILFFPVKRRENKCIWREAEEREVASL